MVKHYNNSISEDAARILNSKQGQFLGDDVQGPVAVIHIERYANIVRDVNSTSTGSITAYITPADKDFYLTSLCLSYSKNVTCDVATGRVPINVLVEGASRAVCAIACLTLTAESNVIFVEFKRPIKVDRNTSITCGATFTAGAMSRSIQLTGYTVETTK